MNIICEERNELVLAKAFLVYTSRHGNDVVYVSEHRIENSSAGATIKPGHALTVDGLQRAMTEMAKAQGVSNLSWTDEATVAKGPSLHVWWTPAQDRWMHFDSPGLKASLPANNPPLVWIQTARNLMVFAMKENIKPTPDTKLHAAPLFNVYENGNVCMGSMARPKDTTPNAWVEAFYSAVSTHANPQGRKLTTYKGGNYALWEHLMTSEKKPAFPVNKLISSKMTLGELVKKLESN